MVLCGYLSVSIPPVCRCRYALRRSWRNRSTSHCTRTEHGSFAELATVGISQYIYISIYLYISTLLGDACVGGVVSQKPFAQVLAPRLVPLPYCARTLCSSAPSGHSAGKSAQVLERLKGDYLALAKICHDYRVVMSPRLHLRAPNDAQLMCKAHAHNARLIAATPGNYPLTSNATQRSLWISDLIKMVYSCVARDNGSEASTTATASAIAQRRSPGTTAQPHSPTAHSPRAARPPRSTAPRHPHNPQPHSPHSHQNSTGTHHPHTHTGIHTGS